MLIDLPLLGYRSSRALAEEQRLVLRGTFVALRGWEGDTQSNRVARRTEPEEYTALLALLATATQAVKLLQHLPDDRAPGGVVGA